jgi:Na+-translocating ferredoxin:NAD+ oxidoreductase RnfG subunit
MTEKSATYEEAMARLSEILDALDPHGYSGDSYLLIFMAGLATVAGTNGMTHGETIGAFARFLDDFEVVDDGEGV